MAGCGISGTQSDTPPGQANPSRPEEQGESDSGESVRATSLRIWDFIPTSMGELCILAEKIS